MSKRIILVGPAAAGKDYLKKKFAERGFELDVSYTTRPPRKGEVDGEDYHFISEREFFDKHYDFYEQAQHGPYWYATGLYEWDNCDIFIMETNGISEIIPEDRKSCFIIYLNPARIKRQERMMLERGWDAEQIAHRSNMDYEKFKDFSDFDIQISDPNF